MILPVPLSWLNNACRLFTTSGWSSTNARDPFNPCSSLPQCPTKMVRLGFGYIFFKIRMASIITIVPVPLSVAPVAPSHESKWAESITYSLLFSVPFISPMVLKVGTSPNSFDFANTLITGALPDAVSLYNRP